MPVRSTCQSLYLLIGVYVPWLAEQVLDGILNASFKLPFKGILVGNGVSNAPGAGDLAVYVPFLYGHGMATSSNYSLPRPS